MNSTNLKFNNNQTSGNGCRPFIKQNVKISSKFSASQPYLPVYETNNIPHFVSPSSCSSKQDTILETVNNTNNHSNAGAALNSIKKSTLALNTVHNNNNNNNSNHNQKSNELESDIYQHKQQQINILTSAKVLLSQIAWSDKTLSLKDIIERQKAINLSSNSSSSLVSSSSSSIENDSVKFPLIVKVVKGKRTILFINQLNIILLRITNFVHNFLAY